MPGLLDLPPELIEQIHHENQATLYAEREDHYDSAGIAEQLGQFRLVCRHVERSIRKSFVKTWFAAWFIKGPDDANIQKFCEMAKTADLAASVISMDVLCEDDGSMQLQEDHSSDASTMSDLTSRFARECQTSTEVSEAQTPSPSEREVTHAFDSATGALVPVAYLKNKDALTKALRACPNIVELWFGNAPIDPLRMHMDLYQRGTLQTGHGHGHGRGRDDDDDDEDADEEDDGYADADDADADDADADNADADNADADNADADDADADNADADNADADDADADDTGEDEDDGNGDNGDNDDNSDHGQVITEHVHDNSPIMFDISSSFMYFLSLAAKAGVKPKHISTFHRCHSSGPLLRVDLGLSNCAGLAAAGPAFEKLEELYLDFIQDRREPVVIPEEGGLQLGRQISEWHAKMPMLTNLCLEFELNCDSHERSSISTWKVLANSPAIPTLKWLRISQGTCAIDVQDFAKFISKHTQTLEELRIPHMHMYNGSSKDLIPLYDALEQAPNMRVLRQSSLFVEDVHVRFPQQLYAPNIADDEDEDGYIFVWVDARSQISCDTHDQVTDVSGAMAEHLRPE